MLKVQIDDVELLVETAVIAGSEPTSGKLDQARGAVTEAFDRAQSAIVALATTTARTINQLRQRSVRPDELEVRFGLKFSAQGSVIVAGAAGEATLEVTLRYRPHQEHESADKLISAKPVRGDTG